MQESDEAEVCPFPGCDSLSVKIMLILRPCGALALEAQICMSPWW